MNSLGQGLREKHKPFTSVGIVGLGLMGGSLARGLKAGPHPPLIKALSLKSDEMAEARSSGVIDEGFVQVGSFFQGLDLVIYCTPLQATLTLLAQHREFLDEATLLTDVASLKVPVLRKAREMGLEKRLVGSHPMAGGEQEGFPASRDGLYEGARVWIVGGEAPAERVARIMEFWRTLGALPEALLGEEHDVLMAWISHLPQLTSNALAEALRNSGYGRDSLGPGGRDMTRLAGSNPEMWTDLFTNAPDALSEALEAVEGALSSLRAHLVAGEWDKLAETMDATRAWSTKE